MPDDGPWQEVRGRRRNRVTRRIERTGQYESSFQMSNHDDRRYRRSRSVGRVRQVTRFYEDGSRRTEFERTNRVHTHMGEGGTVVTPAHTPTSGDTASGLRRNAVITWD